MTDRVEQRRYARAPVNTPATFSIKGQPERTDGLCKDISLGGAFVETASPAAFGTQVIVHLTLPGAADPTALPGTVRWVNSEGMGVQFGMLGAVETHVIIEIGRKYAERTGG